MASPGRILGPLIFTLLGSGLLVTAALGIDAVLICSAKVSTLQAARSGALAGAEALAADAGDSRGAARVARAFGERRRPGGFAVTVSDQDVRVDPERGEVEVTAGTSDHLPTFIAHVLAAGPVQVRASALAEVVTGTTATCLRPWIFPDGFADAAPGDDRFGPGDSYQPGVTSWGTGFRDGAGDRGRRLTLHLAGRSDEVAAGSFHAIDLRAPDDPGDAVGAYARNIARCSEAVVSVGDPVRVLSGPLEQPTREAMRALIALDPGARWDETVGSVAGSAYPAGASPRIVRVAFFDPRATSSGTFTVANIGALFIEATPGGDFAGRLMHATGMASAHGAAASMMRSVRRVR